MFSVDARASSGCNVRATLAGMLTLLLLKHSSMVPTSIYIYIYIYMYQYCTELERTYDITPSALDDWRHCSPTAGAERRPLLNSLAFPTGVFGTAASFSAAFLIGPPIPTSYVSSCIIIMEINLRLIHKSTIISWL